MIYVPGLSQAVNFPFIVKGYEGNRVLLENPFTTFNMEIDEGAIEEFKKVKPVGATIVFYRALPEDLN